MAEDKNKRKRERAAGGKIHIKTFPLASTHRNTDENKTRQALSAEQLVSAQRDGDTAAEAEAGGDPSFLLACWFLVTESCLTLCDPLDWSPPGSSVPGVLQARILDGVAISSSTGSS